MSYIKIKPPDQKQNLNSTINYLFVVAALVVGAAFAGAIDIPYEIGNSSSSINDVGIAPAANSGSSEAEKKGLLINFYLLGNAMEYVPFTTPENLSKVCNLCFIIPFTYFGCFYLTGISSLDLVVNRVVLLY
ncbi:hypothetical protein Dsin_031880 [Dipteronia sinensis]|uniref:Uncharacterized protein n=1 Tax=Dipteronia sinensis TaxID=43782 RepID=A0AAE0DSS1_9ROSI|nr:hypothetical protein Dsin_031880 [Dipteronia sinensis]